MSEKQDRLTRAWELRRDIHAYLQHNIGSLMEDIVRAFPAVNPYTIKQAVQKLRKDLDVVIVKTRGGGNTWRYSAVSRQVRPLEDVRESLRESGRKLIHHANAGIAATKREAEARRAAKAEREAQAIEERDRPRGPRIDPERPWRTTHECGDTAPAQDSRGQGALRQKVSANCFHLF